MNILLFISYALNISLSDSPYFYNKELHEMCTKKITSRIIEWCNPANCIAIDKKLKERQKNVVLVIFKGYERRNCYYYTKGKEIIMSKNYRKNFDDDENFIETITQIVEDLRKDYCEKSDFDIYFSVYLSNNKVKIFNLEKLNNSIEIIKRRFKQKLDVKNIVKFFPDDLRKHLFIINSPSYIKEKTMLTLVDGSISYLIFFDYFYVNNLFNQFEFFIEQYENNLMEGLKNKLQLENVNQEDLFVLLVLFKMKGSLHDKISNSQSKFLLKIWEILKNKVGFYKTFIEIFKNNIPDIVKEKLDVTFLSSIQENKDILIKEGMIDVISCKEFRSNALNYYILMNILHKSTNEEDFEESTLVFISVMFSSLAKNIQSLINVVVSKNHKYAKESDNLRKYNYVWYKKYLEEILLNFIKYSTAEDILVEENEFFGDLSFRCLKKIIKNHKNEISVFKRFDDNIFDGVVNISYARNVD